MRHGNKKRTLHRDKRQREALLSSLARSLVIHEGITTTVAKAKELRPYMEKLVTTGKKNTLASRRAVMAEIGDLDVVKKIHSELADRYAKRAGGYTRIVRLGVVGKRKVESARIEFVK